MFPEQTNQEQCFRYETRGPRLSLATTVHLVALQLSLTQRELPLQMQMLWFQSCRSGTTFHSHIENIPCVASVAWTC